MNATRSANVILSLTLLMLPAFIGDAAAGQPPLFRTPNNNRFYLLDPQTKKEVVLSECPDDSWLHDFKVSPTGALIGVIKTARGFTPPGQRDFSVLPKNSLVIIAVRGDATTTIEDDVQKFSWSPDGEKIAYITGTYYEGGVGFKTDGVWIYDLKDKSKTKIEKDFPHKTIEGFIGGGIEVNWARHDSNIYIEDFDYLDGVYRYNTTTGRSEKLDYAGIDLSPDGKYYKEIEGIRVFRTLTNEDITPQLVQRFGPEWSRVALTWVFDKGHCLHVVRQTAIKKAEYSWAYPEVHNVLYDVEEDRVLREVTLLPSRWVAGPDKLVFEKDGELIVWTYEDVYGE